MPLKIYIAAFISFQTKRGEMKRIPENINNNPILHKTSMLSLVLYGHISYLNRLRDGWGLVAYLHVLQFYCYFGYFTSFIFHGPPKIYLFNSVNLREMFALRRSVLILRAWAIRINSVPAAATP